MMNVQDPPNMATRSARRSPKVCFSSKALLTSRLIWLRSATPVITRHSRSDNLSKPVSRSCSASRRTRSSMRDNPAFGDRARSGKLEVGRQGEKAVSARPSRLSFWPKWLIPLTPGDQHLVGGGLEGEADAEQAVE